MSTWVPDGLPRRKETKDSAFRGLPALAVLPHFFVGKFGAQTSKRYVPPPPPPPPTSEIATGVVADDTNGTRPMAVEPPRAKAKAPPAALMHPPAVRDIREGQPGISHVVHQPTPVLRAPASASAEGDATGALADPRVDTEESSQRSNVSMRQP